MADGRRFPAAHVREIARGHDRKDGPRVSAAAGELITPPAGTIGRGDEFVLEIADRAEAVVLSNDSFQAGTERAAAKTKAKTKAQKQTQQEATAETETATPKKARARGVVASTKGRAKKTATAHKKASIKKTATKKTATADKKAAAERTAEKAAAPTAHHADQDDAYNDRTSFDGFVNAHPVGSDVQAIVERFGSHGAHVVSGDVRAYVPLKNLADPPPRSAKDVLKLGETREFVVAAIDHAKRGVDLALPGALAAET